MQEWLVPPGPSYRNGSYQPAYRMYPNADQVTREYAGVDIVSML